jgi:hypothetical protein
MKDGGQAFPMYYGAEGFHEGMTLRDWYTGQIIGKIIPRPVDIDDFEGISDYADALAKTAYVIADAMINAKEENDVSKTA